MRLKSGAELTLEDGGNPGRAEIFALPIRRFASLLELLVLLELLELLPLIDDHLAPTDL